MVDFCNDIDFLTSFRIVLIMIQIIRILVPIILIIKITTDVIKSSLNPNSSGASNALSTIGRRLFIAMIIFIVPSVMEGVINVLSNQKHDYLACIENATDEKIAELTYTEAKKLVYEARDVLDLPTYMKAKGFIGRVVDKVKRKELEALLEDVKRALEIKGVLSNKVSGEFDNRKILELIQDSSIKENMSNYLDAQDDINGASSTFQNKDEEAIEPSDSETVVRKAETSTLKVYITKKGDNYLTRIWVADPYNQLNKFDSPEYGKKLYKPGELLKKAMNANSGLSNKLIIAFNASGFYKKNTYDKASVEKYPAYDLTSVGTLVITDSKVIRNVNDKAFKTWFVAGVKPNGELQIFTDAKMAASEKAEKKKWSDAVINSKIRSTFTFASILIKDGKASDITTSMPSITSVKNRQAICQVNKNNFILITGPSLNRERLINLMLNEKCITGTNFDGGGSIALLFKPANSTNIETIIGNRRQLTEVGYFTE